jgi:hypothetical protein
MTTFQTPTLNVLNNAQIIGQTEFTPGRFTDTNWIYTNIKKDANTVYKGLLRLWNQRSIVNTPLLNLTELKNNVMYTNGVGGKFRFTIPYEIGLPTIVEDLEPDNDKPGLDGQKFRIKLTNDAQFNNTDRITADYRDGIELFITEEPIEEESDGTVYTVTIVGRNRRGSYYPKNWLQAGTQYMKVANSNSEYDTQKSGITNKSGFMELELSIAGGHRSVTHHITGYASMLQLDESRDPRLSFINSRISEARAVTLYGNIDTNGRVIPGTVSWQNTIEVLLRAEMEKMTDTDLMWGKGGFFEGSGGRQIHTDAGLYEQMRNGNRYIYNTISLDYIENIIANLYSKSGVPVEKRRTQIMTGTGGLLQIQKELEEKYKMIPFLTTAADVGVLQGDRMNLSFGYRFTGYDSPIAGRIDWVLNPALDNLSENRNTDSMIGQFPIESYTYMILDVTDTTTSNIAARTNNVDYRVDDGFNNGANMVLIKPKDFTGLYWGYIIGTHSPFGEAGMYGMQSVNHRDGFEIWMKSFASMWLKDVTRTLIIEKARPTYLGLNYIKAY